MERDPISKFFHTIRRANTSSLTNITLKGNFKTAGKRPDRHSERAMGFARILPIYATILRNVYPNLRKLTITHGTENAICEDDLDKKMGMTDEEGG